MDGVEYDDYNIEVNGEQLTIDGDSSVSVYLEAGETADVWCSSDSLGAATYVLSVCYGLTVTSAECVYGSDDYLIAITVDGLTSEMTENIVGGNVTIDGATYKLYLQYIDTATITLKYANYSSNVYALANQVVTLNRNVDNEAVGFVSFALPADISKGAAPEYTVVGLGETYTGTKTNDSDYEIVELVVPEDSYYCITTDDDDGVVIAEKVEIDQTASTLTYMVVTDSNINVERLGEGTYYIAVYGTYTITVDEADTSGSQQLSGTVYNVCDYVSANLGSGDVTFDGVLTTDNGASLYNENNWFYGGTLADYTYNISGVDLSAYLLFSGTSFTITLSEAATVIIYYSMGDTSYSWEATDSKGDTVTFTSESGENEHVYTQAIELSAGETTFTSVSGNFNLFSIVIVTE